VISNC